MEGIRARTAALSLAALAVVLAALPSAPSSSSSTSSSSSSEIAAAAVRFRGRFPADRVDRSPTCSPNATARPVKFGSLAPASSSLAPSSLASYSESLPSKTVLRAFFAFFLSLVPKLAARSNILSGVALSEALPAKEEAALLALAAEEEAALLALAAEEEAALLALAVRALAPLAPAPRTAVGITATAFRSLSDTSLRHIGQGSVSRPLVRMPEMQSRQ